VGRSNIGLRSLLPASKRRWACPVTTTADVADHTDPKTTRPRCCPESGQALARRIVSGNGRKSWSSTELRRGRSPRADCRAPASARKLEWGNAIPHQTRGNIAQLGTPEPDGKGDPERQTCSSWVCRTTPCSSRAGLATVLAARAGKGARQRGAVTALADALQGHVPTPGPQLKADVVSTALAA
jgi:hypothetical protein